MAEETRLESGSGAPGGDSRPPGSAPRPDGRPSEGAERPALTCQEAMARLWAYIDGELEPESQHEVRRHLERCEDCFPQYDFQRAYLEFLRRHAHGDAPPELRRRVFRRLLEGRREPG